MRAATSYPHVAWPLCRPIPARTDSLARIVVDLVMTACAVAGILVVCLKAGAPL